MKIQRVFSETVWVYPVTVFSNRIQVGSFRKDVEFETERVLSHSGLDRHLISSYNIYNAVKNSHRNRLRVVKVRIYNAQYVLVAETDSLRRCSKSNRLKFDPLTSVENADDGLGWQIDLNTLAMML